MNTTPITSIADISGTVKEGQTLTAGTITPGGATVSYQWQIATSAGGAYTDISGATNNTYSPTSGDVGKYLKVQVTGTGDYRDTITSSATTIIVSATTPITGIAAIAGTAQIGQTLTAGVITPGGATVSYQWQSATTAGGSYGNIPGATNSTYVVSPNVMGKYIKVTVTGTGSYGSSQTSTATTQIPTDSTNWLTIGTQTWAKANLNVGTRIAGTTVQTNNATAEKYCYSDTDANCTTYGGLYQWDEAVGYTNTEGAQGICPAGTHVPSDNDWKILEVQLGMTQAQADTTGYRGTDQGTQLKSGGSSTLNMPLAGVRSTGGGFSSLASAYLWSSSESGGYALFRLLYTSNATVSRDATNKALGFSVRCLGN